MTSGARRAALAAAAAGAFMGFLLPNWQVAVEPAQVLAGLVRYPEDNPFFLYQANLWTAVHQVCAVALRLGATEAGLSLLLGCLLPAVSFSGIALWFTATQPGALRPWDTVAAVLVPFAALAFELGAAYPVWLVGPEHTYGMLGLGAVMLAFGLMANGAFRAGGFVAAVAPALHPSLGAFAILTVVLAWPWRDPALHAERRALVRGLVPGALLTAASLAVHLATSFRLSTIPAADAHHHLRTFVALWDIHRPPFVFSSTPEMLAAVVVLAGLALSPQADERMGERLLARLCFGAWSIALVASLLARLDSPAFNMVLAMMPLRFLNVVLLGAIPLACGRLWRGGVGARLVLAGLLYMCWRPPIESPTAHRVLALMLAMGVTLGPPPGAVPAMRLAAGWCAYVAVGMVSGSAPSEEGQWWLVGAGLLPFLAWLAERVGRRWPTPSPRPRLAGGGLVLLAMTGAAVVAVAQARPQRGWRMDVLAADFRSDPLLQLIHTRPGGIVTGPGVYMLQLRSRRAVLLDTVATDFIPYVPQAGPAMARIFRDVYGRDLLSPSTSGLLDEAAVRPLWEGRPPEEWRRLGHELAFTDVLTPADWQLRLPRLSSSPQFALYALAE